MKYYTYAYLREDGTPYYIGMGSKKRAWDKRHNVSLPPTDRIQILNEFETRQEAVDLEIELISLYGRKDLGTGILHNKTNGGDGASFPGELNPHYGKKHSEETKEKIRAARAKQQIVHSEEWKQKMSEKFKGRKKPARLDGSPDQHSEETKAKISASHKGKPKKKGHKQSEEHKQKIREKMLAYRSAQRASILTNS